MKGSSLEAARRNLDAATLLAERGFPREAASRAYYAAFYAAQVALLKEGEETHTHKGIITSFNRVFVRTGRVPTEAGRILAALHRLRLDADYDQWRWSQSRTPVTRSTAPSDLSALLSRL